MKKWLFLANALMILAACNVDEVAIARFEIPVDTIILVQVDTITLVDTIHVNIVDTLVVIDTTFVADTIVKIDTVMVVDTIIINFVKDSITFPLQNVFIRDDEGQTEKKLGDFTLPPHEDAFGVYVWVEIVLSGKSQKDEAFALLKDGVPISDRPDCPIVPDFTTLGRSWVLVGDTHMPSTAEYRARHAIEFECYPPVDHFLTANSVHFFGIRFVFWRLLS